MKSTPSQTLLLECRRLFLRNYELWMNIGVNEVEKRGKQRVIVNVDVYIPLSMSTPRHDDIGEVVDYNFIRRSIGKRISEGHIHLQETLCDDLLELMLAHSSVKAARVSSEKPDVYPDCDAVGCEVFGIKD